MKLLLDKWAGERNKNVSASPDLTRRGLLLLLDSCAYVGPALPLSRVSWKGQLMFDDVVYGCCCFYRHGGEEVFVRFSCLIIWLMWVGEGWNLLLCLRHQNILGQSCPPTPLIIGRFRQEANVRATYSWTTPWTSGHSSVASRDWKLKCPLCILERSWSWWSFQLMGAFQLCSFKMMRMMTFLATLSFQAEYMLYVYTHGCAHREE